MTQSNFFDLAPRRMTVKAVTQYIRQRLERDSTLQNLWLEGEISNWKPAASGHIYFTLKDQSATIKSVIWRSQAQRLTYKPRFDGEMVLAHGKVSVYEAGGNYQFYVDDLEKLGEGDLHAEFERLKRQLAEAGWFDEDLKQPLPDLPQQIGIVTSATGAALQDILNVLRRRYPLGQVVIAPTLVQGEQAPKQIIMALENLIQHQVEVIIMARGGGSIEDLWAFNNEAVAETMVDCPIPIITGIGHEVDYTIADFVADVRAPTPSAAAEIATPDLETLRHQLSRLQDSLTEQVQHQLAQQKQALKQQSWALQRLAPHHKLNNYRQRIDGLRHRLDNSSRHHLAGQRQQLQQLNAHLEALNPDAVLARGYAIVQKDSTIITQTHQLQAGDEIFIKFNEGQIQAIVK